MPKLIYDYLSSQKQYCTIAMFLDNVFEGDILLIKCYTHYAPTGSYKGIRAMVTEISWEYNGRKLKIPYVRLRRNHVPPTAHLRFNNTLGLS